ncbi:hypothetical protein D3C87_1471570 [compost metagenome]
MVGVEARPHVLDVEDQGVEAFEHGPGGLLDRTVQAHDGQARDRVLAVHDVPLPIGAQAVLGGEEAPQREALVGEKAIDVADPLGVHRAAVGDEPDALADQRLGRVGEQDVDAGPHRRLGPGGQRCGHEQDGERERMPALGNQSHEASSSRRVLCPPGEVRHRSIKGCPGAWSRRGRMSQAVR